MPIQIDESFHGGKLKNMHCSERLQRQVALNAYADKTAVFGMLETANTIFTPLRKLHAVFLSTLEYGIILVSNCK
jgi:hypothetical protein